MVLQQIPTKEKFNLWWFHAPRSVLSSVYVRTGLLDNWLSNAGLVDAGASNAQAHAPKSTPDLRLPSKPGIVLANTVWVKGGASGVSITGSSKRNFSKLQSMYILNVGFGFDNVLKEWFRLPATRLSPSVSPSVLVSVEKSRNEPNPQHGPFDVRQASCNDWISISLDLLEIPRMKSHRSKTPRSETWCAMLPRPRGLFSCYY